MNRVENRTEHQGDPLDVLLRDYFKAEMPRPWPAFQPPRRLRLLPPESTGARRRPSFAGRLALAASVALLFAGTWLLPSGDPGRGTPSEKTLRSLDGDSARPGLQVVPLRSEGPGKQAPGKVKSSLHLEQGEDGRTGIKITVEELPSDR